jgi:hypothetical protein
MKSLGSVLFSVLIIFGCATQIPPSGGPPDTTPPQIIKTFPKNGSVNFKENFVEVEFSEYVDKRSVQDAIFISPYIEGEIKYKWSGRKLKIIFPQKLKENTTYVITFGTEIRDINAGNKMRESFTLAFSTGQKIDTGSIEGKIYTEKENFMVFAYLIDGLNPDTLSPIHTKPDYATQAGKDGTFKFQFIKFGKYRLFAINDRTKNFLYDPSVDDYGVYWNDIAIDSLNPSVSNIIFKTTLEDTSKPFVSSITPIDNSHIIVRFSEKVILKDKAIKIESSKGELPLIVQQLQDSTRFILITEKLEQGEKYILKISKLTDISGNEINPVALEISGDFPPDTTAPSLIFSTPSENEEDVSLTPTIKLYFDDVLKSDFIANLLDSTGKEIKLKIMQSQNIITVQPESELKPGETYTIKVFNLSDINSNKLNDTLKLTFKTVDPSNFGAIEGKIICEDTTSNVIISAFDTEKKKVFHTTSKCNSKFSFEQIPQGKYIISAFIDSNRNGKYDYGRVFPFVPSERFTFYPDTVKVRARWTTENVDIKF